MREMFARFMRNQDVRFSRTVKIKGSDVYGTVTNGYFVNIDNTTGKIYIYIFFNLNIKTIEPLVSSKNTHLDCGRSFEPLGQDLSTHGPPCFHLRTAHTFQAQHAFCLLRIRVDHTSR